MRPPTHYLTACLMCCYFHFLCQPNTTHTISVIIGHITKCILLCKKKTGLSIITQHPCTQLQKIYIDDLID